MDCSFVCGAVSQQQRRPPFVQRLLTYLPTFMPTIQFQIDAQTRLKEKTFIVDWAREVAGNYQHPRHQPVHRLVPL